MLDNLTQRLARVMKTLKGEARLTESNIADALREPGLRNALTGGRDPHEIDGWAVHAGGRSILDAVSQSLGLDDDALDISRAVLRDHGNMSSSTLMFALAGFLSRPVGNGVALAFGPGLAAEGFRFGRTG